MSDLRDLRVGALTGFLKGGKVAFAAITVAIAVRVMHRLKVPGYEAMVGTFNHEACGFSGAFPVFAFGLASFLLIPAAFTLTQPIVRPFLRISAGWMGHITLASLGFAVVLWLPDSIVGSNVGGVVLIGLFWLVAGMLCFVLSELLTEEITINPLSKYPRLVVGVLTVSLLFFGLWVMLYGVGEAAKLRPSPHCASVGSISH